MKKEATNDFGELSQDEQVKETKFDCPFGKNARDNITWTILKEDEAIPCDPSEWESTK